MRKSICPLIMMFLFFTCACEPFSRNVAGATPEEGKKQEITKDELREENQRLREENTRTARELEAVKGRRDQLQERVRALEARLGESSEATGALRPETPPARTRVSIKVLASDGDMETALATARMIQAAGYPPARVDLSENPYRGTKVYFGAGFEAQAMDIASRLEGGGTVIVQPLSWHSIFDIIVVTDTMR